MLGSHCDMERIELVGVAFAPDSAQVVSEKEGGLLEPRTHHVLGQVRFLVQFFATIRAHIDPLVDMDDALRVQFFWRQHCSFTDYGHTRAPNSWCSALSWGRNRSPRLAHPPWSGSVRQPTSAHPALSEVWVCQSD